MKTELNLKAIAASLKRGAEKGLGDDIYIRALAEGPILFVHHWVKNANGKAERQRLRIGALATFPTFAAAKLAAREIIKQAPGRHEKVPSFGEYAETFMARHLPTMKNKSSAAKWRGSLINHCKPIWNMPVNAIEQRHVLGVLDPIWKKIPVMAEEVRARIQKILASAKARGLRTGDNPAEWNDDMKADLGDPPERGSVRGAMASVPFKEMPALIAELEAKKAPTARALMVIAMTCVRTQEFSGMRMRELNLDTEQPTWTIPYARFKVDPHKKTDFVLPLAPQVVRILKEQIAELEPWREVDYLWPSYTKGSRASGPKTPHISNMTMLRYLQRGMGRAATVHGFRASFKTWSDDQFVSAFTHPHFAEQLEEGDAMPKYHRHAVEFCLAHAPGDATERAYRRGMMLNSRVVIMRDWANYLMPPSTANVVPFAPRESIATQADA